MVKTAFAPLSLTSPQSLCLCGAQNLSVADRTHWAGVVDYIGAVFAMRSMELWLLEDIKMQKAVLPLSGGRLTTLLTYRWRYF